MTNIRMALITSRMFALSVGVLALVSASGYLFSVESLYRPIASGPASHPMTIISALLLSFAVSSRFWTKSPLATVPPALLTMIICVIRLYPGETATNLFTVLTPFQNVVDQSLQAGLNINMGVNTAAMFLLLSIALLCRWRNWIQLSQLLSFAAISLPMVAVTGYGYGLPSFYGQMSLMTISFGLPLGWAVTAMSANRGIIRALLSPYVSGRIARIQVCLGYAFPFSIGYLLLKAIHSNGSTDLFGIFVITISWFFILLTSVSCVIHEKIDHTRRIHERSLARFATIDPLTGLNNRRKFDSCLSNEVLRSRRNQQPLSFLMIDIDHFKLVNDTGGHSVGDLVLKSVASTLKKHVRNTDILGRLGGEEFALLLPGTSIEGAAIVAEILRRHVESIHFDPWQGHSGRITASFGCTSLADEDDESSPLNRADLAVYKAKAEGRNRVVTLEYEEEKISASA